MGLAPLIQDGPGMVLAPAQVRQIIGPGPRIYPIGQQSLLELLGERLGAQLALAVGEARIWWPALTAEAIRQLQQDRRGLEGELQRQRKQLADMQADLHSEQFANHRLQTRARSAERRLATLERDARLARIEELLPSR